MLKNYIKIAWRNILKNKTFSIINILGLSFGITCSMLIILWVADEYKVDSFHDNLDRLYTVTSQEFLDGDVLGSYDTPGLLGEELPNAMPEIEMACSYSWNSYHTFATEDKKLKISGNYAGEEFLSMFSYPLIEGSAETALKGPLSIAISKSMADKFFSSPASAIGKTLKFENYKELNVTAVFEDIPEHSSEKFEYLLSWELFTERNEWIKNWDNSGPQTFVLLQKEAKLDNVNSNIREFIADYNVEYEENNRLELGLQPYGQKYLHSNFKNGVVSGGRIDYVRMFGFVALFILLIGCINFMNLSTARSLKRAKEIGVRKVIGAKRFALIKQFMSEALLYTTLAAFIASILLVTLLPFFNQLTLKSIDLPFGNPMFGLSLLALIVVTGLISGSYPALFLSSFKPIAAIKNSVKQGPSSSWFRKGLVIFQFVLCIVFIVSMMMISKQVDYIGTKNLGYQKNNLIYLPITGNLANNFEAFKNESLQIPGIENISRISQRPVEIENTTSSIDWLGKTPNSFPRVTQVAAGYDFVNTMKSTMISGRDFSEEYTDWNNYIVNEAALKIIGYEDPIGKPLTFWNIKGSIIGVIKDFHFNSLHVPIEPLIIRMVEDNSWGYALIRAEAGMTKSALEGLEKLHLEMNPDFPFAHQFADEEYAMLYKSENTVQKLSGYFTFLAILISCMGLLGLVLFAAEQRAKEISIRKVLGASVTSLFALLSRDFMVLIVVAFLIATPLAYWAMESWLENFSYKIPIEWSVFGIAGLSALAISFITISFQTGKSAIANPIKDLRSER